MSILTKPLSKTIRTTKAHIKRLDELGVHTVQDLLHFFPRTYQDKRQFTKIADLRTDQVNNVKGEISSIFHRRARSGKPFTRAILSDDTGKIEVFWFNQPFLQRILFKGTRVVLSGKARFKNGKMSLQSPTYEIFQEDLKHTGRIVPVYHQTEGITSKWIREKLKPLITEWAKHLDEHLPEKIREEHDLTGYSEAIISAHFPKDDADREAATKRLSFDELFLLQLKALQKKWHWQNVQEHEQKAIPNHDESTQLIQNLPFKLTNAQKRSLQEITEDLAKPYPMSRLLQGDVGSGKTVVAAVAILNAIKAGYQTALMAPTEILAKQHYKTLFKLLQPFGITIQFMAGSTTAKQKRELYTKLGQGTLDLIVGTHALIQEGVNFKRLGLAVIDEQHRFGVKQREVLRNNGRPHLLSLSATPIPRTLAMTIYGDQDLSIIDEMPPGRQEIVTRVVPEKKRRQAYLWIENQIQAGRQAYIICPLVDESDVLEVKSAIQEHAHLQENIFPDLKVGLLHGKMKAAEKAEIMEQFNANNIQILVSTSVIEVGIDVPNATIMLIEGADRFGLSQLHQFRGRVGRGKYQSYCFLFPKNQSADARTRLKAMAENSSGFALAEIDLQMRGPGEIYGLRQSGIPDLKMASLTDSQTIAKARQAAQKIINEDPLLNTYPKLQAKITEKEEVYVKD